MGTELILSPASKVIQDTHKLDRGFRLTMIISQAILVRRLNETFENQRRRIMSTELIAISGLGVTIISVGVALAGLILKGQRYQREEIETLREEPQPEFKALREEIANLREEMNNLRERVAHLEGLFEGLREAITGRRVAEETGKYEPR